MPTPTQAAVGDLTTGDPAQALTAVTAAAVTEPDYLSLFALLYASTGLIMLASALIGASVWLGEGAARRTWAGHHLAYSVSFATLLLLAGLAMQAASMFTDLAYGREALLIFCALPVLLVLYLFAADSFCEHRVQLYGDGPGTRTRPRTSADIGAQARPGSSGYLAALPPPDRTHDGIHHGLIADHGGHHNRAELEADADQGPPEQQPEQQQVVVGTS